MRINPLRRWAAAALFFTAPFLAVDAKEVPSRLDVQRSCETFMAQCSLFDEPRLKRAAACACYVDLIMDNYTDASRLRALLDPFALAAADDRPGVKALAWAGQELDVVDGAARGTKGLLTQHRRETRVEACELPQTLAQALGLGE